MSSQILTATLECDKDGAWYYVHVPKEVRDAYKQFERRGAIAVTAKIGKNTWQASILPWADGSGQISVNKKIRDKEELQLGDQVKVEIEPRERA